MEPCQVGNNLYLPDGAGGVIIVTPDAFVVVDESGETNEYEREATKEIDNEDRVVDGNLQKGGDS